MRKVLLSFFIQLFLSSRINIILITIHQFLGSGFELRDWTYIAASIILALKHSLLTSEPESTACLDPGCQVTFVDKDWLLKYLPS